MSEWAFYKLLTNMALFPPRPVGLLPLTIGFSTAKDIVPPLFSSSPSFVPSGCEKKCQKSQTEEF
jgi:hypothetical protein